MSSAAALGALVAVGDPVGHAPCLVTFAGQRILTGYRVLDQKSEAAVRQVHW